MSNNTIAFPFLEPMRVTPLLASNGDRFTPVVGVWCFSKIPSMQASRVLPVEWLATNEKNSPVPRCEHLLHHIFLWPDGAMAFFRYSVLEELWTNLYGGRVTNATYFNQQYGKWTYQVRSLPFSVIERYDSFRTTPHT